MLVMFDDDGADDDFYYYDNDGTTLYSLTDQCKLLVSKMGWEYHGNHQTSSKGEHIRIIRGSGYPSLHAEEKSLSSLLLHNLGLPWNMYLICKAHILLIIL